MFFEKFCNFDNIILHENMVWYGQEHSVDLKRRQLVAAFSGSI